MSKKVQKIIKVKGGYWASYTLPNNKGILRRFALTKIEALRIYDEIKADVKAGKYS